MAKKKQNKNQKEGFSMDNFLYRENAIDYEVKKARKQGYKVRRQKKMSYKNKSGNWWALWYKKL